MLLLTNAANAQFYESGVAPASVRWNQIQTEHFRVIFPVDAGREGQRAANVLEYIHKAGGKSLNYSSTGRFPVVLHNQTAFSNGFVSWAPKRSEFFLTPPQNNSAHNWLDHLALHEYRHVVQIGKLNQGITKGMGLIVGQQAVGAVAGLLPLWFLEGDAVAAETALTNAGRGRNPAFEMPLRTIALSEKLYKYDKALFGSFRNHVPNHYELGYQLVSWTRENYGAKVFETSVDFVARKPHLFFLYPFKRGIKIETGYTTEQMYYRAFADLTNRWAEQEALTGYDVIAPITKRASNLYTSYHSPQYINDSTFIVKKTGMAQIPQWVTIDQKGRETVLHKPGSINSQRISYSAGLLAWTEHVQDARWTNRSYSVVKLFDLQTGMERTLQQRARQYSPALSPDGFTVAVVEIPISGDCAIVLFNVNTGEEICRLPNPQGFFLQTPSWSRDGKSLLTIVNNREGKSIARIDVATGHYTTVLPPTFDDISHPVDGGQYVFFNSYYNGITNVYTADYASGEVMQVTFARFGAFDPQPDASGKKMIYAEYSVNGYDLVEINLNPALWKPVDQLTNNSVKLYETLARQEGFNLQDSIVPNVQYNVKPYRKWANLINVHSWAPMYYEVDVSNIGTMELYPGFVALSQDLLGNLTSSAGYSWRGYNAFHAAFTYKGLYPVFDFKIEHGGQNFISSRPQNENINIPAHQRRTNFYVRSYIPFNLTRSRWMSGVTPLVTLLYNNDYMYSPAIRDYKYGYWRLNYTFQAHRYQRTSVRDLYPQSGFILRGSFQHAPWNTDQFGHIYYINGRFFLPGVAPHHSLRLSGAWQQQKVNYWLFNSMLNFPRGYKIGRTEKLSIGTIDYSMPLFYPDWNLSYLLYLKRLQTNLFCDIAQNQYRISPTNWRKDNLLSMGVDLLADVNILRINFPFNIGIRTAYVPETGKLQPSLLFSVTFY